MKLMEPRELRVYLADGSDGNIDYFKKGIGYTDWEVDCYGNISVWNGNICVGYYPAKNVFKVIVVEVEEYE